MRVFRAIAAFFRGFRQGSSGSRRKNENPTDQTLDWLKGRASEIQGFYERADSRTSDAAVIDLRSSDEVKIAPNAAKPLGGGNEAVAKSLCRLARESQKMGDPKFVEMERIGQQIYAKGGHELMQLVCYRVRALGGSYTYVSTAWNGIGEWRD